MPVGLRRLRARAAGDEGFALPLALSIVAIIGLFTAAAVSFATHSTDRSQRDHAATRAFAAADAGVDAALYRMNRALVASQVEGLFGLPVAALAETECVDLDVALGQAVLIDDLGNGWCPASGGEEAVDGPATTEDDSESARFSYSVSTGINLGPDPANSAQTLIERKVVAIGVVGGVTKRVVATAHGGLGSSGNLLQVFEQVGYKQCTAAVPNPADPGSGC